MSNWTEILNKKVETDKEILSVMPKNTKKNSATYLNKVKEIYTEYDNYLRDVLVELKRRVNKINMVKENPEIKQVEQELKKFEEVDLMGLQKTPYEKMKLDELVFILRRFYKNNLEQINNDILSCIRKFLEVGIELNADDFSYSPFTRRYMKTFFIEYKKGDVNSQIMKEEFEKIYWECSDIIMHIELNIRYLYLKHEKEIEKYLNQKNIEKYRKIETNEAGCLDKYKALKVKLEELKDTDKKIILKKFVNGEFDEKNFEKTSIERQYSKILVEQYDSYTKANLEEITVNIVKLSKTLEEYQNYLKYKFIFDEVLKIYKEKDKYKNTYEKQKKEIQKIESKLASINKKYEKTNKLKDNIFFKRTSGEKLKTISIEINNLILQLKELYRKADRDKMNDKISSILSDNSTIYEALFLASSYYTFLIEVMMKQFPETPEEELNEKAKEIREFITSPFITIINNIAIKEEKNIALMIKDKYTLSNIKITKEDLLEENLIADLNNTVNYIVNSYNVEKSGINLNDVKFINRANKILEEAKK